MKLQNLYSLVRARKWQHHGSTCTSAQVTTLLLEMNTLHGILVEKLEQQPCEQHRILIRSVFVQEKSRSLWLSMSKVCPMEMPRRSEVWHVSLLITEGCAHKTTHATDKSKAAYSAADSSAHGQEALERQRTPCARPIGWAVASPSMLSKLQGVQSPSASSSCPTQRVCFLMLFTEAAILTEVLQNKKIA